MIHPRVEDLIADLTDDGILDSIGNFTLDASKAEEKLKNFALANPGDYLLKAIQFAVASSATEIHLRILPGKVEMEFQGEPVGESHLQTMMAHLVADKNASVNRRIRHLAAAMRGALAASPSSVEFESWDEEQGWCRKWDEHGWRIERLTQRRKAGANRLVVRRTLRQSLSSAAAELSTFLGRGDLTEEERYLALATQRSPVVIHLDGKPLPCEEFGVPRYLGYEISSDPNPGEMRPPWFLRTTNLLVDCYAPDHHLIEACLPALPGSATSLVVPPSHATQRIGLQAGDSGSCRAWISIRAAFDEPLLTVVCDGVLLMEKPNPPGFGPGTRVILAGETLTTDLTGLAIVEDTNFQETVAWAKSEAEKLRGEVRQAIHLYPKPEWVLSKL